jgi:NADPH:quinone reductase-like Zn-dependent oxidoreductase
VLARLAREDVEVVASTTAEWARPRLLEAGAHSVIVTEESWDPDPVARWVGERGNFDAVVDPFFDLHLDRAIEWTRPGGRYITCGLTGGSRLNRRADMEDVLCRAISKNITIIGNCLGVREDLGRALRDYAVGDFAVPIDSTFSGAAAGPFLARSFNGGDRFGKVVFAYDDLVSA